MKSAYCIAIVSCLTVGWLYEEKRKHGIKGNLCWKSTVGYLITRLVFFLISNQEMRGYGATAAMDLVTAGMLYFLSQKSGNLEEAWERVYLYIWNPIPVLAVLSQGKTRMLLIWLAVIYVASYLSYGDGLGNGNVFQTMWDNQFFMLHYHEKTIFDHPYSSEWYEWAWIKRPLLDAYTTLKSGKISVVSTFGNPVIWWAAIPALFYNLYLWQIGRDKASGYLCISYFAMLFPWLFIHRTVFIYQYFACSMIQILMLGNCLRFVRNVKQKRNMGLVIFYLAAVIAVFLLFYPVLSGYPVKKVFAEQWLEWLESWVLS
ncbi:hypothetical protein [Clostridium sp.]